MKVSIAGLGTVGAGLISLLSQDERMRRQGINIEIAAVNARSRNRIRAVSIDHLRWVDDPVALATDPETEVFVELIGGADGPAKVAVESALRAGKPVVTANKALIAEHGPSLAAIAEENGVPLMFEAAVAGGTPVVRGIKDGVAACNVSAVRGILNGTCNYILSTMAETGAAFDAVLLEAQKAGYAEADPSFDVDGIDAAHKITVLAMLAFDSVVRMETVSARGIREIGKADMDAAKKLRMTVKLIAEAILDGDRIGMRVTPAMIPEAHPFAKARGSENVVAVDAVPLGRLSFNGPGAGAGATAAAVAADIVTIARGAANTPVFGTLAKNLQQLDTLSSAEFENAYFLRMCLKDEPGAMAAVADALAVQRISIESLRQSPADSGIASLVIMTHPCKAGAAHAVSSALEKNVYIDGAPSILPIIKP